VSTVAAPSAPARPVPSSLRAAFLVLLFAVLYLPLEEFVLKWAPGGDLGYVLLRLAFEGLLWGTLLVLAAAHRVRGLALPRTPIDGVLALFVVLCTCSLLVSEGERLQGFVNLRVLLRYVAVYYVVVLLGPGPRERRLLVGALLGAALFQGLVGLLQHAQGGAGAFWLPRGSLRVGGVGREFAALSGGLEQGAVLGTTDHTVAFALYLWIAATLAACLLVIGGPRRALSNAGLALLVVLALVAIVFSYVRSCLFALVLALALLLWLERRRPRVARHAPTLLVLGALGLAALALLPRGAGGAFAREKETRVGALESVEAVFTQEYLRSARSSRLWVLTEVGGEIARSAGWLGLGPDEEHVKERLLQSGGAALHRLIAYRAFEDVYWVALLAYYGYLGVLVFALLLARLAGLARRALAADARGGTSDPWDRALARALFLVLLLTVPLGFLAPVFDFRTFSFSFWLLAGLVASRVAVRAARLEPRWGR